MSDNKPVSPSFIFGNNPVVNRTVQTPQGGPSAQTATVTPTISNVVEITFNPKWKDPGALMPDAMNTAKKIKALGNELKTIIVEREDVINDAMVALATGNHIVMLGDPGIAKSMLAREVCKRITGGRYFEWLLNKTSDPSEILGPFSIKALEQDRFLRKTTGKLPEAHIAFLDEIFKSNEPTLNALLAITNERIFHNDGQAVPIPLISLIGASNEEPEDEGLRALYDRLLFRFVVKPIGEAVNRVKMYDGYLQRRNPQFSTEPKVTVSVEELMDIRMAARYVQIPKDVKNQYDMLLMELNTKHQIKVSDRRKNEGLGVLQGAAILAGRDIVAVDDFTHLISIWWQRQEDIPTISEMVLKVVSPFKAKLKEHKESIAKILDGLDRANSTEKANKTVEAKAQFSLIQKDIEIMIKQAKERGKDISEIEDMKKYVSQKSREMLSKNLGIEDSVLDDVGLGDLRLDLED